MALNEIIQGSALERLKELESESVDCCITSPPYWALRDYKIEGQLGLEPTFTEYIAKLIEIFNEVKRVLKREGSCWVDIGDTYSSNSGARNRVTGKSGYDRPCMTRSFLPEKRVTDIPEKSLCLIPQRFQIQMVDAGWICRNTIIWYKPNCMPSSAKDRFTVDFEYLFFFTKSQRYYFDTQYEVICESTEERNRYPRNQISRAWLTENAATPINGGKNVNWQYSPYGRIKRCVWKIATQPFSEAHFAVFPPELVETPIKATCPEYVCKKCGRAREKIVEKEYEVFAENISHRKYFENPEKKAAGENKEVLRRFKNLSAIRGEKILGYNECNCNAGYDGGIVLDPFLGSGTVGLVAMQNARNFIGIELNPEYIKMAYARLDPYLKQERLQFGSA